MGDIPMSDIVIRQPSSNTQDTTQYSSSPENRDISEQTENNSNTNTNTAADSCSIPPTTIGLGPLRNALTLTIKQRIRAFDIISLCTGCEVSNKAIAMK